jgi:hypothetical protein
MSRPRDHYNRNCQAPHRLFVNRLIYVRLQFRRWYERQSVYPKTLPDATPSAGSGVGNCINGGRESFALAHESPIPVTGTS